MQTQEPDFHMLDQSPPVCTCYGLCQEQTPCSHAPLPQIASLVISVTPSPLCGCVCSAGLLKVIPHAFSKKPSCFFFFFLQFSHVLFCYLWWKKMFLKSLCTVALTISSEVISASIFPHWSLDSPNTMTFPPVSVSQRQTVAHSWHMLYICWMLT